MKMKPIHGLLMASALFVSGSANASESAATIAQAKADLTAAKVAGAHWRIIDPATGGTAQNLGKLLKAGEKAAEQGNSEEAARIAARVSKFAKIAIEQSKQYQGATPSYQ